MHCFLRLKCEPKSLSGVSGAPHLALFVCMRAQSLARSRVAQPFSRWSKDTEFTGKFNHLTFKYQDSRLILALFSVAAAHRKLLLGKVFKARRFVRCGSGILSLRYRRLTRPIHRLTVLMDDLQTGHG